MTSAAPTNSLPFSLRFYQAATSLGRFVFDAVLNNRLKKNKEDPARLNERKGSPSLARPQGNLIWMHGASVGETLAILPIIDDLLEKDSSLSILVTSGTITSAELMAKRLPARAFHQYIPVDQPAYVKKFLDHWKPDLAVWVESEFWPNLMLKTHERGTPMALINARMSTESYENWLKRPKVIAALLNVFETCLAIDDQTADRLKKLGALNADAVGNLKFAAKPLPADNESLSSLTEHLSGRPCWIASSTHPGEEELIKQTHTLVCHSLPDALCILIPRHPERGMDLATLLNEPKEALRSKGGEITPNTSIYIADTLGELGLFYRLAPVTFMGGSLVEHGGQNPLEPARLDCAILHGPHVFNFAEVYEQMDREGASRDVQTPEDLAKTVVTLLTEPEKRAQQCEAAKGIAESADHLVDIVSERLLPLLREKR